MRSTVAWTRFSHESITTFEFDVHAMIRSEDAPKLESQLHNHFVMLQMNKVNHRKEFFRVDLQHIREEIEKLGLNPQWTMTAQAAEYRQSLAIERAIKDNPVARKAWVERQLELEHLDAQAVPTEEAPISSPTGLGQSLASQ
jgi:hypothetical protein